MDVLFWKVKEIHPRNLTYLNMVISKATLLFQGSIFRFHQFSSDEMLRYHHSISLHQMILTFYQMYPLKFCMQSEHVSNSNVCISSSKKVMETCRCPQKPLETCSSMLLRVIPEALETFLSSQEGYSEALGKLQMDSRTNMFH